MELVGPACMCPSLGRRINYVKNLKKNFTKLENGVEALCNLKNDIDREIEEIERDPSKILSDDCKGWTEKVNKIVTEVIEIKEEVDENRRCLNGCCLPDICGRRKLGKRIVTMLDDVEKHKREAKGPKYVDAPPAVVEEIPLPDIKGGETAIDRCLQSIMQSIKAAGIHKIGLWGMGGVGKTTALNSLNNHSDIAQTFEVVIWVTVSKGGSVQKVQKHIAEQLQMDIQQSEADERIASKILEKFKTKKYLLLLDDLWSPMNLDHVGIPIQEGSKVVLTTRILNVCRRMLTDEVIKVECLSKQEAWNLFRVNVGDVVDSPSIEPIAKDIVEECDGLPLAVEIIGKSLKKVEDVHVWQNALNQLKSATFQFGDTEAGLFERLKLSYDRLKEVEQSCFLYCALYPEDHEIRVVELVELWSREGFTFSGGVDRRDLDEADDRGHTIVNNLVDASLLEKTEDEDGRDCVKMHDVLRDLALRIASSNFLVRAGLGIEECCDDEKEWEEACRISLMKNKLRVLPTNPKCNAFSTLLLQRNEYLEYIPDMFFQHMHSLRVLDLNWTKIKVLPASVSNLVNLRGLYVVSWKAPVDLPREIGALEKLEVFHVSVGSLPLEIRQLTSLRRLWVVFNTGKEEAMRTICSNGVISSLFLLNDLRIYFEDDDVYLRREWCKVVDVSRVAEEVGRLKRLTRLQFDFSTIECLEAFLLQRQRNTNNSFFPGLKYFHRFPRLKDFHLSMSWSHGLGLRDVPDFGQEMEKTLIWNKGERESSSEVMSQMGNQVLTFELINHQTATNLLGLGMEYCKVRDCPAMKTIETATSSEGRTSTKFTVLPNLKELELAFLPNLTSICEDPCIRFTKLTKLHIWICPELSCVFTQGMIQHMPNLEQLDVGNCEGIEEIVREDVETSHHVGPIFFPRLRKLVLVTLKKLVRIWKGASQSWPSIQEIYILNCPNLEKLNLRFQLISHQTATSLLLEVMILISHENLGMENIQKLEYCEYWGVKDCPAMETIVESNGPSTSTTNVTTVLLNLKELDLYDLPNLTSICEDPCIRFTKLTKLWIRKCPKLSYVFTQGMIQHMPNLEVLQVGHCKVIEEIVMKEDVETNHHLQPIFIPKLRKLTLKWCLNLVRIWKGASQPWPSIQEIQIFGCPNLENLNLNAVDDKNPPAALKKIIGNTGWWEALKWEDEKSKHRLQPLFMHDTGFGY